MITCRWLLAVATLALGAALAALPPTAPVPVFANGTEGYACFRIPAIVRSGDGSLVAFAEGRKDNCGDADGVIRVVSRRSADAGRTWGPLQVVGRNLRPDGTEAMAASPCPVVDLRDPANPQGVVFLLFNVTEHGEEDVTAGLGTRRMAVVRSLDQGRTWDAPRDLTAEVMRPGWRQQIPSVGHAIQLRDGRLFVSAHVTVGANPPVLSQNVLFWSADHGRSWVLGGLNPELGCNESMAVEREDGSVLVNARVFPKGLTADRRGVMVYPMGPGGVPTLAPMRLDPALVTPSVACSLVRGAPGVLLFSGPDHPRKRVGMAVRASLDEGRTWLPARAVDPGPSAYSDLVVPSEGRVGLLYERGNDGGIWYRSFALDWVLGRD